MTPYKSLVEITSSPGFNSLIIASIAARPLPKHKPYFPLSSPAILRSNADLVGLPVLEYSYPLCLPGDSVCMLMFGILVS